MARFIVKEIIYKNGIKDHLKVLKEFTDLKDAKKFAYRYVQGNLKNVLIYQYTSDKTPQKEICWIWFRDFGKSYPYGKWTFISVGGKDERMLNPDGTINRKSYETIAKERRK